MANIDFLDGAALYAWARQCASKLADSSGEINALNVFPVPDADTGSNMSHTMAQAVEAAQRAIAEHGESVHVVAAALASGAVRGARGNSGVVLSQVFAGISQVATAGPLSAAAVIDALEVALRLVNEAINQPVEGTVVTVIRATAAAIDALPDDVTLTEVVTTASRAAHTALANTPSQLSVLRERGVVDAGGCGFVILIDCLKDLVTGVADDHEMPFDAETVTPRAPAPRGCGHEQADSEPLYLEVMCFLLAEDTHLDGLADVLEPLGDSLIVARGPGGANIHIHTRRPGEVVMALAAAGTMEDLRFESLHAAPEASTGPAARLIVAVCPDGALAELYRDAGARVVLPSTDTVSDIIKAATAAASREIILLPNGLLNQQQLVSVELASHATDCKIAILPTARLVAGIPALAVHDPAQPLAVDGYAMAEAASAMATAAITRATHTHVTDAGPCQKGEYLAHSGSGVIAVEDTIGGIVAAACHRLLTRGGELVTLLVTADAAESLDVAGMKDELTRRGVDLMVYAADGMDHPVEIGVE